MHNMIETPLFDLHRDYYSILHVGMYYIKEKEKNKNDLIINYDL